MVNDNKHIDETDLGIIRISPDVIEVIARISTLDVEGVIELNNSSFLGINTDGSKGIKVEVGEKEVAVDISVNIKYGYSIPSLAESIQLSVKESIETMTGLNVIEVNIAISNVQIDK